jgi:hypothetical protein
MKSFPATLPPYPSKGSGNRSDPTLTVNEFVAEVPIPVVIPVSSAVSAFVRTLESLCRRESMIAASVLSLLLGGRGMAQLRRSVGGFARASTPRHCRLTAQNDRRRGHAHRESE